MTLRTAAKTLQGLLIRCPRIRAIQFPMSELNAVREALLHQEDVCKRGLCGYEEKKIDTGGLSDNRVGRVIDAWRMIMNDFLLSKGEFK